MSSPEVTITHRYPHSPPLLIATSSTRCHLPTESGKVRWILPQLPGTVNQFAPTEQKSEPALKGLQTIRIVRERGQWLEVRPGPASRERPVANKAFYNQLTGNALQSGRFLFDKSREPWQPTGG